MEALEGIFGKEMLKGGEVTLVRKGKHKKKLRDGILKAAQPQGRRSLTLHHGGAFAVVDLYDYQPILIPPRLQDGGMVSLIANNMYLVMLITCFW